MSASSLTAFVVQQGLLRDEPFHLLDIGCSGGLAPRWRSFEPDLVADGIDPMAAECARLQALERNPRVRFHSCFLGLPDDHPFVQRRAGRDLWSNNPWERLSIHRAQIVQRQLHPAPTSEEIYQSNRWDEACSPDQVPTWSPTEFLDRQAIERLDFLKIDVDGRDLEILVALEEALDRYPVLGVMLEVNFYGSDYETDNTFHNMDRLMRSRGFELFSLSTIPYSRQALPAPFRAPMPSSTTFGPPTQGDAIYVRDLASPAQAHLAARLTPAQLLKTACVFENIGLPDCAAELLLQHRQRLQTVLDVEQALDHLVPPLQGRQLRYSEYVREFETNLESFYPIPGAAPGATGSALRPRLLRGAKALGLLLAGAGVGLTVGGTTPLLALSLVVGGGVLLAGGRVVGRRVA